MSLKSSNKIETNRYEIEVEVGPEKFEEAVSAAFRKQAKNIQVPGFRKGKATRKLVEKYYGEGVFYDDAVNALLPEAFDEAVKETGLEVINDDPQVEVVSISKEEGFVFKAKLTTKPEVEIKDYKGIEVEREPVTVTDEDIDAEIEKVRDRNSRMITVEDRAAEMGDTAVIDFEGFADGVPFEGGKGEKFSLSLGSGQFIPGFEEKIVGHNPGEEFDIDVTFPEDYQAEELKGKAVVFKIKLHELKKKELPEADDEFAKDVSDFDTLAEYREDLKKNLTETREKAADSAMEEKILDALIEKMEAEIPEAMYKNQMDSNLNDFAYRLQSQGLDINTYMKYTGMNEDSLKETMRPQAERQVKVRLALEKVAELEKIEPTEEDLNEQFEKFAKAYEMEVDKVKELLPRDDIAKDVAMGKTVDFLKENAKITEKAEKAE